MGNTTILFSVSYSIAANWANNSWNYTGNDTGVSLDAGQWTSSATGTYQNDETDSQGNIVDVDGTMGVTSIVNWGYNGTVTLNPNTSGSLTMTSGGGNWTGDNQADWSYSGSGSYNDDDTDSSISEQENNSNYTTYSIQATWNTVGQTYSYSGNQTATSLDTGSWANTIDGDYTGSDNGVNMTGTTDLTNSVSWSSSTTTNQVFDPSSTATGGWDTTLTTRDNNLQTLTSTENSGSGAISYYPSINDSNPLGPDTPITGTASDDNGNTLSSSYTWQATGTAGTDGSLTYVYSGNGTALSLTYDDFNYSDSGNYSLSYNGDDGDGGTASYTDYVNYTASGSADTSYNVTTAWNLDPTAGTWTASGTTVDAGGKQTGSYDCNYGGNSSHTYGPGTDISSDSGETTESLSYDYHLSATQGPDGSWGGTLTGDGQAYGDATYNEQGNDCLFGGTFSGKSDDQYTYSNSGWSRAVNADGSLGTLSGTPSNDTTGSCIANNNFVWSGPPPQTNSYDNTYDASNSAGCCTVSIDGMGATTYNYTASDGPGFDPGGTWIQHRVGYGAMVSNDATFGQGTAVPSQPVGSPPSVGPTTASTDIDASPSIGGTTADVGTIRQADGTAGGNGQQGPVKPTLPAQPPYNAGFVLPGQFHHFYPLHLGGSLFQPLGYVENHPAFHDYLKSVGLGFESGNEARALWQQMGDVERINIIIKAARAAGLTPAQMNILVENMPKIMAGGMRGIEIAWQQMGDVERIDYFIKLAHDTGATSAQMNILIQNMPKLLAGSTPGLKTIRIPALNGGIMWGKAESGLSLGTDAAADVDAEVDAALAKLAARGGGGGGLLSASQVAKFNAIMIVLTIAERYTLGASADAHQQHIPYKQALNQKASGDWNSLQFLLQSIKSIMMGDGLPQEHRGNWM